MKSFVLFRKTAVFLLIFTALYVSISAQNKVDSLENILKKYPLTPTEKIDLYNNLSTICMEVNLSKAILYAKEGILLAEEEKNNSMMGILYKTLGATYMYSNQFDSANSCLYKALEYAQQEQDNDKEAAVHAVIGSMYNMQQSYSLALEYYMKALAYYESCGKELDAAKILHNMAAVYENTYNHEKALEYLHKAETTARKFNDQLGLAKALSNMASIYGTDLYNEWDKALKYAEEAHKIFEDLGSYRNLSTTTQRFVVIYAHHKKDYQKAIEWAEKGLHIAEQLESNNQAAFSLAQISSIYFMMENHKACIQFGLMAAQRDTSDLITQSFVYGPVALSYAYLQNMDSAFLYLNRYNNTIVGTAQEDFQRSFSEMEVKYETEKKEMEIITMEEERKLYTLLGISLVPALLLALVVFIIRQQLAVSRRKSSEQQVKQLEQEKQLIAIQSALDGEISERTRLAKDLHDGLGGMLSSVKLNLYDIKKGATINGDDMQRFEQVLLMLNNSIIELRLIAHNMMPDSLTRYGLKVALTDFCNNIPCCEFHYFGSENRLNSKLETMLYRTIHELINNAMKHSGAEHILIQVVKEDERISFTVQDDGHGFDPAALTQGTGLNNIKDRIASFNGQISVWSEIGKGTEVSGELKINF